MCILCNRRIYRTRCYYCIAQEAADLASYDEAVAQRAAAEEAHEMRQLELIRKAQAENALLQHQEYMIGVLHRDYERWSAEDPRMWSIPEAEAEDEGEVSGEEESTEQAEGEEVHYEYGEDDEGYESGTLEEEEEEEEEGEDDDENDDERDSGYGSGTDESDSQDDSEEADEVEDDQDDDDEVESGQDANRGVEDGQDSNEEVDDVQDNDYDYDTADDQEDLYHYRDISKRRFKSLRRTPCPFLFLARREGMASTRRDTLT
jgi:hypothetical protein